MSTPATGDVATAKSGSGHQPVNILLVDDNPAKLVALDTAIAPLGENIIKATSGADALRELLAHEFAVIILDVSMPVMDGFETARMIRGRQRTANTPIIFASAINLAETDALRGYALGAVDYILAPVVPEVLRAKISVFVQLYRKTQEVQEHVRKLEERTRQLEQSQMQLRMAERMASLGTLAAGLGHDMGNLLLPIQARLDSVQTDSLPADVRDCLSAVNTSIGYLRRLAGGLRLLALSPGDDVPSQQATELPSWWDEVEPMLKNALPRGIHLQAHLDSGLPQVLIARHLLTQVVFNLVQNAGDVLRERGWGSVAITASADKDAVNLHVKDDGPGMSDEVRRRCVEPFFTTKSRTLSTGLGLAMVNGIMERCGGTLSVETAIGEGTTFTCRLRPAGRTVPATAPTAAIGVHDPRLRAITKSLLEVHGFHALHCGDDSPPQTLLWLRDAADAMKSDAAEFLRGDPRRLLVLFGEAPFTPACDRVILMPRSPPIPELRGLLGSLARQFKNVAEPGSLAMAGSTPPEATGAAG
jgi:signal transduction histidine kinase